MNYFKKLENEILVKKKNILGICVGMQVFLEKSEEGLNEGLNWVNGTVVKFSSNDQRIPHMGWNELSIKSLGHPVFKNVHQGAFFYFVHSFHMQLKEEKFVLATADYGDSIAAVVGKDNMIGTQFHPEKSQKMGLLMLENFLNWRP